MNNAVSIYKSLDESCNNIRLNFSSEEIAKIAEKEGFDIDQLKALDIVFHSIAEKKKETTIATILRMSRLPQKTIKTFNNFDFSIVKGKNVDKLKGLSSLAALHAHKNIAFIGPAGTGKTHLAQAFGYECCMNGFKTYFIKMSELRDKFTNARRNGKESSVLNGLVRPSCLIIDEVGHCEFDKENTRLFFDMIDRRYNKEGSFNTVFTSNKNPSEWCADFNEDDTLLCALDRIFDDATVFTIRGESYRGKSLEKIALQTVRVTIGSADR